MVMDINAPSPQRYSNTRIGVSRCPNNQISKEKSDRESKIPEISKHVIFCTEKRFNRGKMGRRSITTQRLHSVPKIPHAHNARSETPAAQTFLDGVPGLKRRVLACANIPSKEALPWVQIQRPILALPRNAIRLEYCAENLYKVDGACDQNNGIGRYIRPDLSGRFTHHSAIGRKMLRTQGPCYCNSRGIGVDNKHREISSTTIPNLRLVGSSPRSPNTYCECNSEQHGRVQKSTRSTNQVEFHHKTLNNASARVSKLDRTIQPDCSNVCSQNQSATENIQESNIRCKINTLKRHETQPCQMGPDSQNQPTARQSTTYNNHPNGCLTQRLGIPDRSVSFQGRIRSVNEQIFNKHIGTTDNMVCFTKSNQGKPGDTDTVRQLNSSGGSPSQQFHSISPINDFRTNLEKGDQDEMDTQSVAHPREIQHCSRSIEQEHSIVNRMVSTTKSFQTNHENEHSFGGGLIRHSVEQSTGELHFSMSGSKSSRSGCHGNTMGQMGPSVPLSPVHIDFEGFTEIDGVPVQECDSNNTRHSNQTMVYGTETPSDSVDTNDSVSTTNSGRQIGNSSHSYQTSRLEVIKQAYNRQYPNCRDAVTLMATPIRKSSIAEYQKKWNIFMSYLQRENIPFDEISITSVIKFLNYLFEERHLSPNTVAHYKSALVIPLQAHFNIDLNATALKDLLRAMNLLRPSLPVSAPAWSLNKVLTFMERLANPISLEMLLRKTAFLLMLATGWRISELHACVRDQEYCYFTGDSVLHIRPHPSFLAKNECTQRRWDFKEIRPLRLGDGSISRLCPVTTTRQYLQRTQMVSSGSLFITPKDHSRTLTIHKLSAHICSIIRLADDVAKIKPHDVRKYASSCSFVNTMLVGDLVSAMNWSSPATFFKFYFSQTEPLSTPVALPVCNL